MPPFGRPAGAAEASAALAAAYLVFTWANQTDYAELCLKHAMELYEFADKHRGVYHDAIPDVYDFYRSWEVCLDHFNFYP